MSNHRLAFFPFSSRKLAMALFLAAGGCAALAGCELLAVFAGHGKQPALYTFPKNKRILVLVDLRPESGAPPTFAEKLGDRIGQHLYQNKAADHIIPQDKVLEIRQRTPATFDKLGVADIAQAVDADMVLVVYVIYLDVTTTSEGSVTQGSARAQVKVVDRNGINIWPGDVGGTSVEAHVDPALSSDRDKDAVYAKLQEILTTHTGRMFHAYDLEDKQMTR